MKWYDVSKKEPPYNEKLLFGGEDETWDAGYLSEIHGTEKGKTMTITSNGETRNGYKFWAKPQPPKQ